LTHEIISLNITVLRIYGASKNSEKIFEKKERELIHSIIIAVWWSFPLENELGMT